MSNNKNFSFLGNAFYPLLMVFAIIILALSIGIYHHESGDAPQAQVETVSNPVVGEVQE